MIPEKLLIHDVRYGILLLLSKKTPMKIVEIMEGLSGFRKGERPFPLSTLQHHLKKLKEADLVKVEEWVYDKKERGNPTLVTITEPGRDEIDTIKLARKILNYIEKLNKKKLAIGELGLSLKFGKYNSFQFKKAMYYLDLYKEIGIVKIS